MRGYNISKNITIVGDNFGTMQATNRTLLFSKGTSNSLIRCGTLVPTEPALSHTSLYCTVNLHNLNIDGGLYMPNLYVEMQQNVDSFTPLYITKPTNLFPRFICETGNSIVTVRGIGFPENEQNVNNLQRGNPKLNFDSQSALQQYYNHVSHEVRFKTLPYTGINLNAKTSVHSWQFSMDATENYDFAVGNQTFEYYKRPNVTTVVPWAGPNGGTMVIRLSGSFAIPSFETASVLTLQTTSIGGRDKYNVSCSTGHYNSTFAACTASFHETGLFGLKLSQEINQGTNDLDCYSNSAPNKTNYFVYPYDMFEHVVGVSLGGRETIANDYFTLLLDASFFYGYGFDPVAREEVQKPFLKFGAEYLDSEKIENVFVSETLNNMHINSTLLKLQVDRSFFLKHSKTDVIIVWLIESSNVTEKRLKRLPYIVLEPNVTTGAYIDIWTRTDLPLALRKDYKICVTFRFNKTNSTTTIGRRRRLKSDMGDESLDYEYRESEVFHSYVNFKEKYRHFQLRTSPDNAWIAITIYSMVVG